jgi:hypothetical protein
MPLAIAGCKIDTGTPKLGLGPCVIRVTQGLSFWGLGIGLLFHWIVKPCKTQID